MGMQCLTFPPFCDNQVVFGPQCKNSSSMISGPILMDFYLLDGQWVTLAVLDMALLLRACGLILMTLVILGPLPINRSMAFQSSE